MPLALSTLPYHTSTHLQCHMPMPQWPHHSNACNQIRRLALIISFLISLGNMLIPMVCTYAPISTTRFLKHSQDKFSHHICYTPTKCFQTYIPYKAQSPAHNPCMHIYTPKTSIQYVELKRRHSRST